MDKALRIFQLSQQLAPLVFAILAVFGKNSASDAIVQHITSEATTDEHPEVRSAMLKVASQMHAATVMPEAAK